MPYKRIQDSPTVLAAALINRAAVVQIFSKSNQRQCGLSVQVGKVVFLLEDTVCAGAIAHSLVEQTQLSPEELAGNDEVISAIALYSQWQNDLLGLFHQASHGQRLLRLECL